MSFKRNKDQDRLNTQKMLKECPRLFSAKNWLDHSGACAKVDETLLEGASFAKLISSGRQPSAVRSHLYHLKTEHGLTIDHIGDLYSFSGVLDLQRETAVEQISRARPSFITKKASCPPHSSGRPLETVEFKGGGVRNDKTFARKHLVAVVHALAAEKRANLERLKKEYSGLARPDFIWYYLSQSFSTMGRASGWHGLIGNKRNYERVTYNILAVLTPRERKVEVQRVCHEAGIRMPDKKADYILGCFDYVKALGGPEAVKMKLLAKPGREAKISFLQSFPGIGPKYARNIMMDVYHEDFRDSIALDVRITGISDMLGLSFSSYSEHEAFYLNAAKDAGINGWELDRLLFNFREEVELRLRAIWTS